MEKYQYSLPHGYVLQSEKNRYVIDHVLGQGSYGITYLAKYKTTISGAMGSGSGWTQVAIKEFFMRDMNTRDGSTGYLNDASQDSLIGKYRRAFVREAHNLAKLSHPGIVNIFEVIETNNTVYIVMEFIDGGSLDEYISSKGHLSEKESLTIFCGICIAVGCMHQNKMLHLDLKPKNIMLDDECHPLLIDFGLSKQYTENGEPESSTSIGQGTPGYAPIEQAERTDNDTSFRPTIDIYALGGTLYKMLTGNTPPLASKVSESAWEGDNLITSTLKEQGISDATTALVTKAMYPASKKRYQSTAELVAAIDGALQEQEIENKEARGNDGDSGEGTVVELTVAAKKTATKPTPQSKLAKESKKGFPSWLYGIIAAIVVGLIVFFVIPKSKPISEPTPTIDDDEIKGKTPAEIRSLGYDYQKGTGGKSIDYAKALKYYHIAAERGNDDAMVYIGYMYEKGYGVSKDYTEALKWYRKAAEQGNASAQSKLGYMYRNGYGVEKDYSEAMKWYRKSAEQGNANGQNNLGFVYEKGYGVSKDYTEAVKWYRKSAEQGNAYGQCNLGYMYDHGYGVAKDYSEAVKWYRKAADQGNATAQYNLGVCYKNGWGVDKDLTEAKKWFEKAAAQGDEDAKKQLSELQ